MKCQVHGLLGMMMNFIHYWTVGKGLRRKLNIIATPLILQPRGARLSHGMVKSLKKIPLHHSTAWSLLALFPGPKRRRGRKGLVSAVCGSALIDELMSGSSLDGKIIFKKPLNSEHKGFLLQVNLQHKTLISKAFYFKNLLTCSTNLL